MDRNQRSYKKQLLAGVLILLAGFLLWSGFNTLRLKAANIPASFFTTNPFFILNDAQGANDYPGQKDMTRMGRWDHDGYLDVFWSWDEIQPKGSTFDACALFDSTGSGNPTSAICAELKNFGDNQNNPSPRLNTAAGFPKFYSCDGTQPLNCGGALLLATPASLQMGDLMTLDPTKDLITDTDPFGPNVPLGPGDAYPYDTTVRMKILKTDMPGKLINVCSYESASLPSAVGDCVANSGGGFLKIVKNTTVGDGTFTFDVNPVPSSNVGGPCNPAVTGCVSYQLQTQNLTGIVGVSVGVGQTSVSEENPGPAFSFTNASCQYENGGPTGTLNPSTRTVSGIGIQFSTVTVCTFTNTKQPAHITVTKVVVNDNGGTASVPNYTLKVGNNVVTSGVSADVVEGTYAITESGGPSGYTASFSGDCDANGNITLKSGVSYSCTITNNDIPPSLTLSKIVTNNNGGSTSSSAWTLSAAGPTPISGAGGASSGPNFSAGTYTLSESGGPSGYTASGWSCTGGSQSGNQITLAVGQSASCTITNDDIQPQLIVKKVVNNTNGGTKVSSDFTINVTGNAATPSSFPGSSTGTTVTLNAGNYSVSESVPTGYAASYSTDCSGSIAVGQTKTCTITNQDQPPTLKIIKHVVNNNGGTATADQWTMHVGAGNPSQNDFAGSETGVTVTINAGQYSVDETGGPSGYAKTLGAGCSGTMPVGGFVTCTITNDDTAPSLTLVKKVINDAGGTASTSTWTLNAAGPTPISGAGGTSSDATFSAGTYTLSESGGPSGYQASAWTCTGGSQNGNTITLALAQTATCTITNDDIAAQLIIVKQVVNAHGGTADPSAFSGTINGITAAGGNTWSGASTTKTLTGVGSYTVTENTAAGYAASYSADCSSTISLGQTKTCTITNNDIAPSLTLTKTVRNNYGGTATAAAFTLSATGPTPISGAGGASSGSNFVAGTYTLSETGLTGYAAGPWVCTGGTQTGTQITLGVGQSATCNITNSDIQPKLTVVKTVNNTNGGTAVSSNFTMTVTGNSVTPSSSFPGSASGTTVGLNAGSYSVSESGPAGYAGLYTGDCSGTIAIGQTKTCTVTNQDQAGTLTVIKHVVNNYGGTATADQFTMHITATNPTANDFPGSETGVQVVIGAGSFKVSEAGPSGYAATMSGCSGTMPLGGSATCTITNSDIAPQLLIVKQVVNTHGGTATPSAFSGTINGIAAVGGNNWSGSSTTKALLGGGAYTVSENPAAGYTASFSPDCAGTISIGQTKTCTISNQDQAGTLTVIKHVNNTYGGTAAAGNFTMAVTAGHPSANNFPGSEDGVQLTIDAGSYSVNETGGPSNYSKSLSSGCSGTMTNGGNAICTITNNDTPPTLTIIKQVFNNSGGTATPGAFSGSFSGITASSGNSWSGATTTKTITTIGSYTVTENPVFGYAASYSADCSGSISSGNNKTCTITNSDIAPVLTLTKVVNNVNPYTNDGTATPTAFTIGTTNGPTNISGLGFASSGSGFSAGTYTLAETGPAGYTNGGWTCAKNGGAPTAGTSISLSIGDTAACTVTNNAVDVPPSISVSKVGDKTNLTGVGGAVTFTVAVKNTSNPLDPFWITSLTDDLTGNGNPVDVTAVQPYSATAPYISATNCALTPAGSPIAPGSTYSCQFTVQFPVLTNNATVTYHDIVRVTGGADDTLSTTNTATGQADAFVTEAVPMQVTDSSLCVFNTGSNPSMRQFDRNFTLNGFYTLGATNPGQFYWNVNVEGTPGTQKSVTLTLPWPFITQGNMPVHVYDGVFFNPTTHCYIPGHEVASVNNLVQLVTYINQSGNTPLTDVTSPTDWGYPNTVGPSTLTTASVTPTPTKYVNVTITFTMPATGFAYINQHLDDGLKGSAVDVNGDGVIDNILYNKDGNLDATIATNVAQVLIPDNVKHTFSVADETNPLGSDAVYNNNWFKKSSAGFFGFVSYNGLYMPGQTVQVWQGSTLIGSAVTDSDGFYTISYKATGKDKASPYNVTLVNPASNVLVQSGGGTISTSTPTTQSVTLKSNGNVEVDFPLMP